MIVAMVMEDRSTTPHTVTIAGPVEQVARKLAKAHASFAVAFLLPGGGAKECRAIAQVVEEALLVARNVSSSRKRDALEALVEAMLPPVCEPGVLMREAEMISKARAEVMSSTEWLTAVQVAELAGLSLFNPNAQPSRWKREGKIFAVRSGGLDRFPGYGLDPEHGFRPVKALAEVISVLQEMKDVWGMAYWFASVNGFLGGRRPQDVLSAEPALVIEAAKDEVEGIGHG